MDDPADVFLDNVSDTMAKVRGYFQLGNLDAVREGCLFVVDVVPTNAEAWYFLGLTAYRQGRNTEALDCLRRASDYAPTWAEACNHYGNALREHGRFEEALEKYLQARSLKSNYASPDYNIGLVLTAQKKIDEAERSFNKALEIAPDFVPALNNLGLLYKDLEKYDKAIECFNKALVCNPNSIEVLNNISVVLLAQKKSCQAIEMIRRAVTIAPDCAEVYNTLGLGLKAIGSSDEAIVSYRHALVIKSDYLDALNNLGNLLRETGRLDEAQDCLQRALTLQPEFAVGWHSMGILRKEMGAIEIALSSFLQARIVNPGYLKGLIDEADAYTVCGQVENALEIYRIAMKTYPLDSIIHSNMLMTMQYSPHYSAMEIFNESKQWDKVHGKEVISTHANEPDPLRKLRIGYVSPDFRSHSISHFLKALFTNHCRANVGIFCYSDVVDVDADTEFYKAHSECWRDIADVTDNEVIQCVIDDRIDILVDLAGHTGSGRRLAVFTRKPAPIQITWLGYPDTTGLAAMDYRFSDDIADPPGIVDEFYSEKIMRLSGGFLCYNPPDTTPEVCALPSVTSGQITFGSFNTIAKITPDVVSLWSYILANTPGSRLILKNKSMRYPAVRSRYAELFASHGISAERVIMRPLETSQTTHLAMYGEIDIALDSFPYNGTTTTCEALWMGVPVVTLTGERHAGRVGASILSRVGLGDLVAASPDDYLRIAVMLARDKERLQSIRASLRKTMCASPLCDGTAFAIKIEGAFRSMWQDWCTSGPSS